ncbi:MAG: hypothetical protein JNM42_04830 [Propionivibrio sp.]|uniref:hypothetical protein n=1 Tax=Propionivibrio sp. TaxID=2212460 RepID=UPI001A49E983|nr:hypothetical protein [Propionivibrio sp.]MBL8413743.1 hypothetical protein [Propionivibrio sp.]
MSARTPIPVTRLTGLPGVDKTKRLELKPLLQQPALARNNVEIACARLCALEVMEARR